MSAAGTARRAAPAVALCAALLAPAAPAAAQFGGRPLNRGDHGRDVRALQRTLGRLGLRTRPDGIFGRRTAAHVRRYERREELRADARVSRVEARGMLERARRLAQAKALAAPAPGRDGTFPIAGRWHQGRAFGGGHQGIDLLAACGTPLVAPVAMRVTRVASGSRAGHYLVARAAASGEDLVLMHMRGTPLPAAGDALAAGDRVGEVGETGNATACHLHFEIWTAPGWYRGGSPRDPAADLAAWSGAA